MIGHLAARLARALVTRPLMSRSLVPLPLALVPAMILALAPVTAHAQALDLSRGGPIAITAEDGIEWRQVEQQVIARGNARAVRQNVTVTADRLIAWYRKKGTTGAPPPGTSSGPQAGVKPPIGVDADSSGNEVYRFQAEGNVLIFTETDQAYGDKATYDIDQAVMVMTGRDLKLITQNEVLTARDSLEYWAQKRMAVARGNAVVVTNDAKRLAADTLVAYTSEAPPASGAPSGVTPGPGPAATPKPAGARPTEPSAAQSGKLEKMEAFGNVSIRTPTDFVTGDRGVYVPDIGIARLGGQVRITRGETQLNGSGADVNMKTGVARLTSDRGTRVQGLVVPGDQSSQGLPLDAPPAARPGSKR